jgi:hypothetical protein
VHGRTFPKEKGKASFGDKDFLNWAGRSGERSVEEIRKLPRFAKNKQNLR